jgi:hypothetical protein
MRQWLINPRCMCVKHLMGEHVEHHMFVGSMKKKTRIDGFLENNLLEPMLLESRHAALADEMLRRGYNHKSPLEIPDDLFDYLADYQIFWTIDREKAIGDLLTRCGECLLRYREIFTIRTDGIIGNGKKEDKEGSGTQSN